MHEKLLFFVATPMLYSIRIEEGRKSSGRVDYAKMPKM
jgi:hypothetical protein